MVACSKIVLLATGAAARRAAHASGEAGGGARRGSKQEPHGGKLVNLFGEGLAAADCDTTLQLTERRSCDVELLCNGGFSPLDGVHGRGGPQVGGRRHEAAFRFDVLAARRLRHGLGGPRPRLKILLKQGDLDVATFEVSRQVRAGQAPSSASSATARRPSSTRARRWSPWSAASLFGRQAHGLEQAGARVPLRDARRGARAPPGRRRHRRLPVPQPRAPRTTSSSLSIDAERRRRPSCWSTRPAARRSRATSPARCATRLMKCSRRRRRTRGPSGPTCPTRAHGRPARGHPPHDDPQELRLHALHHRPRHGRLQVVHRRGGLLRAPTTRRTSRSNGPRWACRPCPR